MRDAALASDTEYVLHHVPTGAMTHEDRSQSLRLMNSWSVRRTEEGARKAELILDRLLRDEDERRSSGVGAAINWSRDEDDEWYVGARVWNVAITSWAKLESSKCGSEATRVFEKMKERFELSDGTSTRARPDIISYNSVLVALANDPDPSSVERAEALIAEMELNDDDSGGVRPDTTSYNVLINAYANRTGEYGSAERAEDVLLRMSELSKDGGGGKSTVRPDTASFNTVLKAWHNSGERTMESAIRSEAILRLLCKVYKSGHDVRPDPISFSTCLRTYRAAEVTDEEGGIDLADRVRGLIDLLENTVAAPTERGYDMFFDEDYTQCYHVAIEAVGNSGVPDAGLRAEVIFGMMEEAEREGWTKVSINEVAHAQVLYAWMRGDIEGVGDIPKDILMRIFDGLGVEGNVCSDNNGSQNVDIDGDGDSVHIGLTRPQGHSPLRTTRPFNLALRSLCERAMEEGSLSEVERVDNLLRFIETNSPGSVPPDIFSYNTVMHSYMKVNARGSARKMYDLLVRLEGAYDKSGMEEALRPTSFSYNAVVSECSKVGDSERACQALYMAERQVDAGNPDVAMDVPGYNMCLNALAQKRTRNAAVKALDLLKLMEKRSSSTSKVGGAGRVRPDMKSYTSVINAWERIMDRDSPKVVLSCLRRLETSYDEGGSKRQSADDVVYTSVLLCLARSKRLHFAEKARDLLAQMEHRYRAENNTKLQPTSVCCNLVVKAFADAGRGSKTARAAERVLMDLVERHRAGALSACPDTYGFNHVIHAWAKSSDYDDGGGGGPDGAAVRAGELVRSMKRLGKEASLPTEPDRVTITSLISIFMGSKREGLTAEAQKLFDAFEGSEGDRHGNNGNSDDGDSLHSKWIADKTMYDHMMDCWAKSYSREKLTRCRDLLQRMEERSVSSLLSSSSEKKGKDRQGYIQRQYQVSGSFCPDTRTYNILLNCCARTATGDDVAGEKAMAFAYDILDRLEGSGSAKKPSSYGDGRGATAMTMRGCRPDEITYGTILKAIGQNVKDEQKRAEEIRDVFERCRYRGLVGDMVMRQLKRYLDGDQLSEVLGGLNLDGGDDLPDEWVRGTREHRATKLGKMLGSGQRRGGGHGGRMGQGQRLGTGKGRQQ